MAPMTNWLTFSLSPMEMLRSSDQSQFVSYDASSAASSSPYLLDNFYGTLFFLLLSPTKFSLLFFFVRHIRMIVVSTVHARVTKASLIEY